MKTGIWRGKKTLRRWEEDRHFGQHQERLRSVRPVSCELQWLPPTLNQNKRLMQQEDKFTEIERENRCLLEKIATTMRKRSQRDKEQDAMHRSLHAPFRKRQQESIEVENARLLKRLQDKKSDYDAKKLKQDWKRQKKVIESIAFYPFILRTSVRPHRRRAASKQQRLDPTALSADVEIVRARQIDGEAFVVTLLLTQAQLRITAQRRSTHQDKVIEIPRPEALAFIEDECAGNIEGVFGRLTFDALENVLYLVGSAEHLSLQPAIKAGTSAARDPASGRPAVRPESTL